MWNDDVEISLCRPAESMDYFFRNGEGDEVVFVHEGSGTVETIFGDVPYQDGDYVVIPRGTTYRFRSEGTAALPRVRDAGADRDPEALPQRLRAADGGRAVLPPRHPSADGAAHGARAGRVPREGARPRRLPDVRHGLPSVRRGRLGRLPLSVDVLDPRLRADHRTDPPAAAVASDLPGAELRHLLVLSAQARLRPAGGADPVRPLEPAVGGDDLLRLRQLRLAARRRRRLDHAAPVGPAARAAAGARGEEHRHARDERARRHVRHLPSAEAVDVRARPRRRQVHVLVVRERASG